MGNSRNPYNLAVVAFVALGSLAFGYAASIISTTLAQPSFMLVISESLLYAALPLSIYY